MSQAETEAVRATPAPLDPNIGSIQPGGGICYDIELAWGRLRRWYLETFRSGYVRRMAALRHGDATGAPHDILDPRDLKYCRNQCTAYWDPADNPFQWRGRIPFARWGLAELQIMLWPALAATIALALSSYWYLALAPAILLLAVVNFFRDPPRRLTLGPGLLVSPADGKVVEIARLEHDAFIGGPAVRISIFLTLLNVHVNRMPIAARLIRLRYSPGKFVSAARLDSATLNENMWIGMEEVAPPYRRLVMRQVSGQFARRIVCDMRLGEVFAQGEKFGMIKLGSRAELIVPAEDDLQIDVQLGQWVNAGRHVLARYTSVVEPLARQ
jgi:phosphatidylserine decarboxylase